MAQDPVIVCLSAGGTDLAARLSLAHGWAVHGRSGRVPEADAFFEDARDHVATLFSAGVPVIGICAAGILIRAVAPFLSDKRSEPPVIAIAEDGTSVVPLLGGHHGANTLAAAVAETLDAAVALTTAGDVRFGVALDAPPSGWRLANPGDAKAVMAAMLNGEACHLAGLPDWLEGLARSENVQVEDVRTPRGDARAVLTPQRDGRPDPSGLSLTFHGQHYVLGVGCARNCDPAELARLIDAVLAEAGVPPEAVAAIGSLDLKADEPAMLDAAARLGVPFRLFSAAELEAEAGRLQTPSDVVFAEVGCHGVSEGAALALAGAEGNLVVAKRKGTNATVALARSPHPITRFGGRARGKLSVVGIGPGQPGWRTPEASRLIAQADELVGYGLYIDLLGPLAAGKDRSDFPLGGEEARCRYALERAGKGHDVALVCSGDAGIYAMGALVFELLDRGPEAQGVSDAARRVEVVCTPGVSALQAAAARAGAPLGHDFCAISLSDLLTPRADILRRLQAAAEGDFVIAFYNPVSRTRRTLLAEARDILLRHRPADTPVMLAASLGRPEEHLRYRRLDALSVDEVDMLTVVIVGSSNSRLAALGEGPRMYTPRGYARRIDGDLARSG